MADAFFEMEGGFFWSGVVATLFFPAVENHNRAL